MHVCRIRWFWLVLTYLPVCEDAGPVPVQRRLHERGDLGEDGLLGGTGAEDLYAREGKWLVSRQNSVTDEIA